MYDEKNTDCALYGTEECAFLNSDGCLDCYVARMKKDEQQQLLSALAHLKEEAPLEEVEPLYTADECLLCKPREGGERGKAECYALFDMAKDDPAGDWAFKTGGRSLSKKSQAMLLPLQVCCCKSCRRRCRVFEFVPVICALIIAGLGLYLSTETPLFAQAQAAARWLPFALFAGFVAAAFTVYFVLRSVIASAVSKKTELDMTKLPAVSALAADGWREAQQKSGGATKLVFANKLRKNGVYTVKNKEE